MALTGSGPSPEETFGLLVRRARENRGWSQDALARRLKVSYGIDLHLTAIGRVELGQRPIRLNEAVALAQLLSLDFPIAGHDFPTLTSMREYTDAVEQHHLAEETVTKLEADMAELRRQQERELAELQQQRRGDELALLSDLNDWTVRRDALERAIEHYERMADNADG